MKKRFPDISVIKANLIHKEGTMMYPCLAGALSSYYVMAAFMFEELRGLAQAAIEGTPDDAERLADYLHMLDEAAEFTPTSDSIAAEVKC